MNRFSNLTFLPLFVLSFCLGIFLIKFFYISFSILYFSCWFLLALCLISLKKNYSVLFLLVLGVLLGALHLENFSILASSHIIKFYRYLSKSEFVILKGVVDDYPIIRPNHHIFILKVKEIIFRDKLYRITGKLKVLDFLKSKVKYGEELILKGRLSSKSQDYLKQKGIHLIFTVGKNGFIKKLRDSPNLLKYFAYKIRTKSLNLLFENLPFSQAGILSAMLLGEKSYISPYFKHLFIQTGTIHILAISGLHVGVVSLILNILLKASGFKKRVRYGLIISFLIPYCFLTGSRPPVVRATTMAIVILVGFLLKRCVLISHSLSLACLLILLSNPYEIFDVGFQLSFLGVISIVYISPEIKDILFKDNFQKNIISKFFVNAFSLSLSCWLGLSPFILYYFKIISPITVFANMVVVPYLSIVISLGICFLLSSLVSPFLSSFFAQPMNLSIILLVKIVEFFGRIPFAYFYLK